MHAGSALPYVPSSPPACPPRARPQDHACRAKLNLSLARFSGFGSLFCLRSFERRTRSAAQRSTAALLVVLEDFSRKCPTAMTHTSARQRTRGAGVGISGEHTRLAPDYRQRLAP